MTGDLPPPAPPDLEDGEDRNDRLAVVGNAQPVDERSSAGASPRTMPLKGDRRTFITQQGTIDRLMLPSGFLPGNQYFNEFSRCFEYQVDGKPEMKIAHWIWDNESSRLDVDIAEQLQWLLSQDAHVLTEEEMDWIEEVIPAEVYGHNGAFDVLSVRTEEFGGRNVLVLENRWWDADRRAFGLFFPSAQDTRVRESLHFEGTDRDFRANFLSAKVSFMRVKWRTAGD